MFARIQRGFPDSFFFFLSTVFHDTFTQPLYVERYHVAACRPGSPDEKTILATFFIGSALSVNIELLQNKALILFYCHFCLQRFFLLNQLRLRISSFNSVSSQRLACGFFVMKKELKRNGTFIKIPLIFAIYTYSTIYNNTFFG